MIFPSIYPFSFSFLIRACCAEFHFSYVFDSDTCFSASNAYVVLYFTKIYGMQSKWKMCHTQIARAVETHKVRKGIHNQSLSVSRCAKYNNAMHCLHWFINTCASTRNIYFNKVILHCSVRFGSMLHGARETVLLRVVWRRTRTELIYECNISFIKLNRK